MLQTDLSQPSILTLDAAGHDAVTVPGGAWLLKADFSVQGSDLLLTGADGAQVLIRDFFSSDTPPDLMTDSGAVISAELSIKLAGPQAPGQFALMQNGPFQIAQATEESVGKVEATDGLVEAIHTDGSKVILTKGSPIYQGDTIVTAKGAAVGITFIDDTTFSLGEEGRMVLDELVYDPGGEDSTFNANLVQGVFSFVSGQIAKTTPEGMTVSTPVATIGIRGTKVAGRAAQEGELNTISLLPETDAQGNTIVGELTVQTQGGVVTLSQVGATVQLTSSFAPPPPPVVFSPQQIQQQYGSAIDALPASPATNQDQGPGDEADAPEGDAPPDGEAPPEGGEQLADGAPPPEGEALLDGALPPEGEALLDGALPPEGEVPLDGEAPLDGEVLLTGSDLFFDGGGLFDGGGGLFDVGGIFDSGTDPLLGEPLIGGSTGDILAAPIGDYNFDFSTPPSDTTIVDLGVINSTPTTQLFGETLYGTMGNDSIVGNSENTRVIMAQGTGLGGNDIVDGGAGTDEIAFLNLDNSALIFNATVGADVASFSASGNAPITGTVNLMSIEQIFASDGIETFIDTSGTTATAGANGVRLGITPADAGTGYLIAGGTANDTITIANGTNLASTYSGLTSVTGAIVPMTGVLGSIIFGKGGDDTITGSVGGDIIFGGTGNDTINGGGNTANDADLIFGGVGNDVVNVTGASNELVFIGGAGLDTLNLSGATSTVAVAGDVETITGSGTVDTVVLKGVSATTVTAGGGADVLTLDGFASHTVKYTALADGGDIVKGFANGAMADVFQFATAFGGAQTSNLTLQSTAGAGTTGANVIVADTSLLSATPATALADVQTLLGNLNTANTFISTTNKFIIGIIDNDASGTITTGDKYALYYDADVTIGNAVLIATTDIDAQATGASTWDASNISAV